jgi:phosphoribosyl 1,2-cyclic phosphodiesterase
VLASGSSGNAALISTGHTRVLVDAGLSLRELTRRLELVGETPERLSAVVITHEHSDHIAGLPFLARRLGLPVYLSRCTAPLIDWGERGNLPVETFQAGTGFSIGDIDVATFSVPHDAADPVGFCFHAGGVKIGMVTDLGYIPDSVKVHLRGSHALVLESNHDLDMLKVGPYPWAVKQRVMSRMGHLSNLAMSEYLSEELDPLTRHVILAHLSAHNNHPAIVRLVAAESLARRGAGVNLLIAAQGAPCETLEL